MSIVDIIKIEYGMTTKEAKEYNKKIDSKTRIALINGFNNNSKKCFYND